MSWDGKIYDKYRIAHADGTPLKGKKYFVLRLDSDDPVEAARVSAALRAYKNEPRNCDIGTAETELSRMSAWCRAHQDTGEIIHCRRCHIKSDNYFLCALRWAQMPYEADAQKGGEEDADLRKV
jgi:hypothetical protein